MKSLITKSFGAFSLVVSVAAAFVLSACGGGESKAEAYVKEKYPNAKILSFSEIQKEFGVKNKECLVKKGDFLTNAYVFIEENGKFKIVAVETRNDKGVSHTKKTYSDDEPISTFEYFKSENAKCFN